jgi:hypothetical protein
MRTEPREEKLVTEQATEERMAVAKCRYGSASEQPCPRPATTRDWFDGEGVEPTTCAEHVVVTEIAREEDDLLEAQHYLEKWLAKARKRGAGTVLTGALERALEEVLQSKRPWQQRLEGAIAVADNYEEKA